MYPKKQKPFWQTPRVQGELDGFCGLYSLINAGRRIVGKKLDKDAELLMLAFQWALNKRKGTFHQITEGVGLLEMLCLVRRVMVPNYRLQYKRPFAKRGSVGLTEYWWFCQKFLQETKRGAIVFAFQVWTEEHWTVAWRMTQKTMMLLDSGPGVMESIRRSQCTMRDSYATDQYAFYPSQTIFLWRS